MSHSFHIFSSIRKHPPYRLRVTAYIAVLFIDIITARQYPQIYQPDNNMESISYPTKIGYLSHNYHHRVMVMGFPASTKLHNYNRESPDTWTPRTYHSKPISLSPSEGLCQSIFFTWLPSEIRTINVAILLSMIDSDWHHYQGIKSSCSLRIYLVPDELKNTVNQWGFTCWNDWSRYMSSLSFISIGQFCKTAVILQYLGLCCTWHIYK